MKGESNGYSERIVALLLVVVVLASVAQVVGAVSADVESMPDSGEVGSQVSATVLLTDLYRDPNLESWTLDGETALTDVTWTVTYLDQGGNQIDTQSVDGQELSASGIALDDDVSEVRVKVTGTVPAVRNYQYRPRQTFEIMSLTQTREGGTSNDIDSWTVYHYTPKSQTAREAIDSASTAVDDAQNRGADTATAEDTLDDAIAAYETGSFDLAITLAEKAQTQAQSARQSAETFQLAIYAGLGLVGIVVIGGLVYWYQNRETPYDRLG